MAYAEHGYRVLPIFGLEADSSCSCHKGQQCRSQGKHPHAQLVPKGYKDASCDPATVLAWWQLKPMANIGLATGGQWFVVDVDLLGLDEWHRLIELHGDPGGWIVDTGSGGEHRYFRMPHGMAIRCGTHVLPGIDVRGEGGLVVAPPSHHKSGVPYRWRVSPAEGVLPDAPQWVVDLVTQSKQSVPLVQPVTEGAALVEWNEDLLRDALRYVDADNYTKWVDVGHALKGSDMPGAEDLWIEWGRRSPKFDEAEAREKWSCDLKPDGRIGLGSVLKLAGDAGWKGPQGESKDASVSSGSVLVAGPEVFRELQPLRPEQPSVAPFDLKLLPDAFAGWIADIAERMQCPPDFPAVAAMVALGVVVGRKSEIPLGRLRDHLSKDIRAVQEHWGDQGIECGSTEALEVDF